jgi:hypothetical protein
MEITGPSESWSILLEKINTRAVLGLFSVPIGIKDSNEAHELLAVVNYRD